MDVTEALGCAVQSLIDVTHDQGFGEELPKATYEVFWYEAVGHGRREGRIERRQQGSFYRLQDSLGDLWETWEASEVFQALAAACGELAETGQAGLSFPGSHSGRELALTLLREYFQRVGALRLDEGQTSTLAEKLTADLLAPTAPMLVIFSVDSFSAPVEFELSDDVTFRHVSDRDIDRFGRLPTDPVPLIGVQRLTSDGWICEARGDTPKDTMRILQRFDELIVDTVGVALSLTTDGSASFTMLFKGLETPFISAVNSRSTEPAHTGFGGAITLSEEDIQTFKANFSAVRRIGADTSLSGLELAFRRMRRASSRRDPEDQLVDYVIGLESLLCADASHDETSFRFRLRGAALLPDSFGAPRDRIAVMRDIYGLRSSIVHREADPEKVRLMLPSAESALKVVFAWYLRHAPGAGNPRQVAESFDERMVSAGGDWATGV